MTQEQSTMLYANLVAYLREDSASVEGFNEWVEQYMACNSLDREEVWPEVALRCEEILEAQGWRKDRRGRWQRPLS